jgi:hypothetical protein
MGMSANLHGAAKMVAMRSGATEWLHIENKAGDHIGVFMPYAAAQAIADIWLDFSHPAPEVTRIMAEQEGAE